MKSWDQQNYLVIGGFCYIQFLYNEVPLYLNDASTDITRSLKELCPFPRKGLKAVGPLVTCL